MKNLLIQTAKATGLVDVDRLKAYFEEIAGEPGRIDELLLNCPSFTEEAVLKLLAEAMGMDFFSEIDAQKVPKVFVEKVPAGYAQAVGLRSQ